MGGLPHVRSRRTGDLRRGDVKFAGLVGLATGWFGWTAPLMALIATFVLSGSCAIFLLATRRAHREDRLPLGPFMLVGAVLSLLVNV